MAEISRESSQVGEARTQLESVVTAAKKLGAEALNVRAQMNLVQLDITEKKFPDALVRIDEMLKGATDAMKPALLLLKAQTQYLAGDAAGTKSVFEEMQKTFADSQETKQARLLLSLSQPQ